MNSQNENPVDAPHPWTEASASRRRCLCWIAAGMALGATRVGWSAMSSREEATDSGIAQLKVAAIQMAPKLGDVEANLAQAEQLVREAIGMGAEWIMLPEMFTSAAAFHEDMVRAIRPLDGAPAQLLKDLAREAHVSVGGSFLARDGDRVYNAFLLAFPDGSTQRHDKDFPTYWETCYYMGGHDEGVLKTPVGPVGAALCWEMVRSGTVRRLAGKIRLLVAGSTWWTLPEEAAEDHPLRAINLQMLRETPPRLAQLLGVPVVHASHVGPFEGFDSPELPDVPYRSRYLGETMITDATGGVLARRGPDEGAGMAIAKIALPENPTPAEAIPERFWIPEQMPDEWKEAWSRWFPRGEDYYKTVTMPYLTTGELDEYVPSYLRE